MMATNDPVNRQPSTEDICREAAERLSNIQIRNDKNGMFLQEISNERPPPYNYSEYSFYVPPPPPPSPGDALKEYVAGEQDSSPIPSAPPPPPLPPLPLVYPPNQDTLAPPVSAYHTGVSPNHLPVVPALSHGVSPEPSPIHNPAAVPMYIQPQMPGQPSPLQYPSPAQGPATSTPLMAQPPPPPPPPPLPMMAQYNTQTTNNQNINTNTNQNVNNVNVNVEAGGPYRKRRRYPNYMCFSIVLCLLCWALNPAVYICILPALACSCYSCTANTYRKSRFGGKWSFSCNLTALVCGFVSFTLVILPFVVILSLSASGLMTLWELWKKHKDIVLGSGWDSGSDSSGQSFNDNIGMQ